MNAALINAIKTSFINRFEKEPLLVWSPGRINIIGDHTDYNDGFVLPAAIDKGIVTAVQKSDSGSSISLAVDKNESIEFSLTHIKSLAHAGWENYVLGVVAEILKTDRKLGNFNVAFGGNIPEGAGMASSAALENSIVYALNELFNLEFTKKEMITISQKAEHHYVGVKCGIMDQYASMFGIKNNALLIDCRTVEATPLETDLKEYELLLINTNVKHSLSDSAYNERRFVCESVAVMLKKKALRDVTEEDLWSIKDQISKDDYQKALFVIEENARVIKAFQAIQEGEILRLGRLLYDSHHGLQSQYKVSCVELDFLVDQTKLNSQVIGSRMMGGGFGGCTINLIAKNALEAFKTSISAAYFKKFNKECSIYPVALSCGTQLVK